MTDAELAHTKELAFWMTERVFMNPISAKLLNEDWRKAFPDDVAVAERMKALVEALESAQRQNAQDVQIKARICRESNRLHDRLREAERRIAELEARTVTVKPPAYVDGNTLGYGEVNHMIDLCVDAFERACHAAGINLTVEG